MMQVRAEQQRKELVWLVWIYFALLIAEGALRKWLLPSLSDALLVVRDPVAAVLLFLAIQRGYMPANRPVRAFGTLFLGFLALAVLHTAQQSVPLAVTAFGLRTYFLHVPLIFIIPAVLDARDVRRLLVAVVVLGGPIALLMAAQFRGLPTDWINRGVGEGGLQIRSALGKIRPPGPFSFVTGPVLYFGLVAGAIVGSHLARPRLPLLLQAMGWGSVFLATAVSGSRSLVAGMVPVLVATAAAFAMRPGLGGRGLRALAIAVAVGLAVWTADVVQDGVTVLDARFEQSGTDEMLSRSSYESRGAQLAFATAPLFGYGLGLGTNAGGTLAGGSVFELGEGEWQRVIFEAGPALGTAFMVWRLWLVVLMARMGVRAARLGDPLPLLLLAACGGNLALGQWGQPTALGFAVLGAGLCLAAGRTTPASGSARTAVGTTSEWRHADAGARGHGGRATVPA